MTQPRRSETADRTLSHVLVNGEPRALDAGMTVGALLRSLALEPRMVVVERNREIIRDPDALDLVVLGEGDEIEIVHFVGGG